MRCHVVIDAQVVHNEVVTDVHVLPANEEDPLRGARLAVRLWHGRHRQAFEAAHPEETKNVVALLLEVLALDVGVRDGRIKRGDLLLLEAFGGGFTWGSALVRY